MTRSFTSQREFDVRFDWGARGLEALSCDELRATLIIDVLSFTTSVCVAVERGAAVLPSIWDRAAARTRAVDETLQLAGSRGDKHARWTLSPASLSRIEAGTRLLLPSPNGSQLSFEAARRGLVVAACLRNASAVAAFIASQGGPVALIAAGERWPDGSLRPCLEDLLGAGAVAARLNGSLSPEAQAAAAVYLSIVPDLHSALESCGSGRELIERGFDRDVELAARIDITSVVPVLQDGAFSAASA